MPEPIELPPAISPSSYARLTACTYQVLLERSSTSKLLPGVGPRGSGGSAIGNVVHKVLEAATLTGIASPEAFELVWQRHLARQEAKMLRNGQGQLVPLAFRAKGYAVTKLLLKGLVVGRLPMPPPPPGSKLPIGAERRLTDTSGHVSGVVDLIRLDKDGVKIIDYKTGQIFETESTNDLPAVKSAYSLQLQLYAALLFDSTGHWPDGLLLANLTGQEFDLPFNKPHCLRLLEEARALYQRIDRAILHGQASSLASPSTEQCHRCRVKSLCEPYASWAAGQPGLK